MLKRHGLLKRHRSIAEELPHDVVELIMERLPAKSLVRLRSVSKKWRWTIYSKRFQEIQMIRRRESRGADVIFVSLLCDAEMEPEFDTEVVLGSSIVRKVSFPFANRMICHGTCDDLLCLYCLYTPCIVLNPATQWHRSFPFSGLQQLIFDRKNRGEGYSAPACKLGFGKDIIRGTYKPVWLYNSYSSEDPKVVTTCEVFDFSTNAWRYLVPASPYRILRFQKPPVYLDGSLYWLTDCVDAKVLSFDLHTETFKVISKAPPCPCN